MPHLLDNSYVNLDILPGSKPEEMTDKAQETTSEGASAAGYVLCLIQLFFAVFVLCADTDLGCAEAISPQLLPTFRAAIKSRTPYPAEPVKHKKELELQGM